MNQALPDDLLRPSLGHGRGASPPLSSTASFLVSFFGGGLTAGLVALFNARALLRPRLDWALGVAAALVSLVLLAVLLTLKVRDALPDWISLLGGGNTGARRLNQIFGVVVWGLFTWLQRKERLAQALSGQTLERSWVPILAILGLGVAINFLMALLVTSILV